MKLAFPKPRKKKPRPRRFGSSLPVGEKTPRKARKPVKARNDARRKREFARCYGSAERVEFVRSHGCLVAAHGGCEGPIDNAHIRGGGAGRKADARFIVGLCRAHHRYLHSAGVEYFEEVHDVSLARYADRVEAAWQAHVSGQGGKQ